MLFFLYRQFVITNSSGERRFNVLKGIKNHLTITEYRLSSLLTMTGMKRLRGMPQLRIRVSEIANETDSGGIHRATYNLASIEICVSFISGELNIYLNVSCSCSVTQCQFSVI